MRWKRTTWGSNLWCDRVTEPLTSGTPEHDVEETHLTLGDPVYHREHGPVLGSPRGIDKT